MGSPYLMHQEPSLQHKSANVQIEKETLAIVYSAHKFHAVVESDHKPLQYIFNKPSGTTTAAENAVDPAMV